MTPRLRRLALPLLLAAGLAACGGDEPAPPAAGPPADASPGAPAPAATDPAAPAGLAALDEAALRDAARLALAEQRVYAPAGDNAIEYTLALRERHPAEAGLREALTDFAPYALIAAERAIAAGDLAEGERLATLLGRIDADAPALPRLRAAVEAARERREAELAETERRAEAEAASAAQAQAAQQAAAAAPVEAVPVPAATAIATPPPAPTPVETAPPPPASTGPAPAPPEASPPPQASAPAAAAPAPEEPRAIATPAPRYPPLAQRRRIEGEVRLMFTVGVDGSVSAVEVESATPPEVFDREAIAAVSRWRFAPLQAPVRVRRTLRFRLPDAG